MDTAEFIARARSALGRGVPYGYGTAFDPQSMVPPASGLDCSTFVRWAAKLALPAVNQGAAQRWDTTGIVQDATGAQLFFAKIAVPRPGCLIVYPDYTALAEVTGTSTHHDGHVGIVTETGIVKSVLTATRVIHCSRLVEGMRAALTPGAQRDALIESDPLWFPVFEPMYAWCLKIGQETRD
ncbi:MAG TPA: CHAP domain-containing protein [Burkholderiales bacterium]|jgi:cell wall-associated NlpC family hydrolase|nr:CHAP domain-containing protein [Burkholderiales bacterium]